VNTLTDHPTNEYSLDNMSEEKPDRAQSGLTETMVARIEIEELADPARQKETTDAIAGLEGVTDVRIENGALHVSYDALVTTDKKIEQAVRSTGAQIKTMDSGREGPHPDLPTRPT